MIKFNGKKCEEITQTPLIICCFPSSEPKQFDKIELGP